MTKDGEKNNTFKIIASIGVVLTLATLVFAAGIQWGEVRDLKVEGCDPAKQHITQIAVIETKLNTIIDQQEKILGRLPK